MEQTSSLTAESDWSAGSRVTISLVSPIWSRKETPWMEPREFVRLGAVWPPLERRLQRVAGGLGDGDGVGGATWWGGAKERGDAGGGLLSADIGCYLWRCPGSRKVPNGKDIKKRLQVNSVKGDLSCRLISHRSITDKRCPSLMHPRGKNRPKEDFWNKNLSSGSGFPKKSLWETLQVCGLTVFTSCTCWKWKKSTFKHHWQMLSNFKSTFSITLEVCSPYHGNIKTKS